MAIYKHKTYTYRYSWQIINLHQKSNLMAGQTKHISCEIGLAAFVRATLKWLTNSKSTKNKSHSYIQIFVPMYKLGTQRGQNKKFCLFKPDTVIRQTVSSPSAQLADGLQPRWLHGNRRGALKLMSWKLA